MDIRIVNTDAWMQELAGILRDGHDAPLQVTGNSMAPFLRHGRDRVQLRTFVSPAKKGDILLYRRSDGQYILHRVVRVKENLLWFAGDAQQVIEGPLPDSCVLASVVRVQRKGKTLTPNSFLWKFYRHLWPLTFPVRNLLRQIHIRLHK